VLLAALTFPFATCTKATRVLTGPEFHPAWEPFSAPWAGFPYGQPCARVAGDLHRRAWHCVPLRRSDWADAATTLSATARTRTRKHATHADSHTAIHTHTRIHIYLHEITARQGGNSAELSTGRAALPCSPMHAQLPLDRNHQHHTSSTTTASTALDVAAGLHRSHVLAVGACRAGRIPLRSAAARPTQ
jgi:hypothetical protein